MFFLPNAVFQVLTFTNNTPLYLGIITMHVFALVSLKVTQITEARSILLPLILLQWPFIDCGPRAGWREVKWSRSVVSDSATPWTVAHQAPRSVGFSRHECWSGLPFPSPGSFPTQGLNPGLLHCRQTFYCLSYQGSPCAGYVAYIVVNPFYNSAS